MAKAKRHHSRKSFTLPLAVVGGFAPLVIGTVQHGLWNGWVGSGDTAMDYAMRALTGFDPNHLGYGGTWNPRNMLSGTIPIVAGIAVHKLASRLGINRALGQMRIPLIRI